MRRHLNTLYVTTADAWVRKDGENIVVEAEGSEIGRVPIHRIGGLVCFGRAGASPALLGHCAEKGVGVSFLTPNGRFLARVEGPVSGNVLLRRAQYRATDDPAAAAALVRNIVAGKIANQRAVLRRGIADHGDRLDDEKSRELCGAEDSLINALRRALHSADIDGLRGIEGEAAHRYFAVFDHLITHDEATFRFAGRSRRPPLDPVNALLSFLYVLLLHDCRSALEGVGLDPAVGFLHRDRPGRASLALDLMEELRPFLADRLALSLVNRRQLKPRDFETGPTGAVTIREEARKAVLVAWQERKKDEVTHPFLGEKTSLGLVPHLQAQLMARHLRGDLDGYPAFIRR